jgi:hypothetical protein
VNWNSPPPPPYIHYPADLLHEPRGHVVGVAVRSTNISAVLNTNEIRPGNHVFGIDRAQFNNAVASKHFVLQKQV